MAIILDEGFEAGPAGAVATSANTGFDTIGNAFPAAEDWARFNADHPRMGSLALGLSGAASGARIVELVNACPAPPVTVEAWACLRPSSTGSVDLTLTLGGLSLFVNFAGPAPGTVTTSASDDNGDLWSESFDYDFADTYAPIRFEITPTTVAATIANFTFEEPYDATTAAGALTVAVVDNSQNTVLIDDCSIVTIDQAAVRKYPRDDGLGHSSAPRKYPSHKARRIVGGYT